MGNIYDTIRESLLFKKFILDQLLLAQYTCPIADEELGIWSQTDYFMFILSGKKTWRTIDGEVVAAKGDIIYVKKGGTFVKQFFDQEFCMIAFFVNDDFIRKTVHEVKGSIPLYDNSVPEADPLQIIKETTALHSFFNGMLPYFREAEKPQKPLLELKFKELIIGILCDRENLGLAKYFLDLADSNEPPLPQIMESNFYFNLSMEELAKMCHRSLSSFKRDFKKHYNTTPGKWLLEKRLNHAAMLLHSESASITQVAFDSGFEDSSHFSRAFKAKFGEAPLFYRERVSQSPK